MSDLKEGIIFTKRTHTSSSVSEKEAGPSTKEPTLLQSPRTTRRKQKEKDTEMTPPVTRGKKKKVVEPRLPREATPPQASQSDTAILKEILELCKKQSDTFSELVTELRSQKTQLEGLTLKVQGLQYDKQLSLISPNHCYFILHANKTIRSYDNA
ncbi:PREDICTED: uncharacterized protein LOC108579680 [Habropoda laboriosa]|uniref:uncharacterized protein LOC108579680 n=1 Tax=Habropoda laboriosa TaxID=597456 RepID=UPI00083CDC07|nr:PREDICTED: uncharacterized protein LOC108579680 [Habropoda laboriosa]